MSLEQNDSGLDPETIARIKELTKGLQNLMDGIARDTSHLDQAEAHLEDLKENLSILKEVQPKISGPKISPQ